VNHKPRLLSDNGSSYISADLAEWLDKRSIKHVRGSPYHPQAANSGSRVLTADKSGSFDCGSATKRADH
jgi:transposase InsO family protein